jgi:acyl-CoA thioesterase
MADVAHSSSRDDLARRSAAVMLAEDHASRGLGMTLDHVAAGAATVSMVVTTAMVNGHGLCHGGFIFTLADSAFAFACNSHNQRHVAQSCQISYLAPGRLGMRLTAEALERHRADRSGITDVTVRDQTGLVIAEFRGASRSIPGLLIEGS